VASLLRRLPFAVLAATLLIAGGASAAAPEPVVRGNEIIDSATSEVFVPHGVDFPGFEYACQQGWGYGPDGTAPAEIGATAAAIASWNVNTVRLPLNEDCWLGRNGLPKGASFTVNGYRQAVEKFVDGLNDAGIVAILDLHWSNPDGAVADGLRPMPDQGAPEFWSSVAARFKDYRSVIFDLFNEPHSRWNSNGSKVFGLTWNCWAVGGCQAPAEPDTAATSGSSWYATVGMDQLTKTVRAAGATQPIILSGIDYANDLRGWLANAPHDSQLIAGFHNYPGQRCHTNECWEAEIATLNQKVPVLTAEFGQNDCGDPGHVTRYMDWADSQRIGYLAWAWWDLPVEGCHNYALVSDLDGTPLAPVGTALHDHLLSLPDVLPKPPDPVAPRLVVKTARWNGRNLQIRISTSPKVALPLAAKVRLARNPRDRRRPRTGNRLISRRLRVVSGSAAVRIAIPVGLKPTMLTVSYPGDSRFTARTVKRRPTSVSKVTRRRHRG